MAYRAMVTLAFPLGVIMSLAACGGINSTSADGDSNPPPPPPDGFGYIEVSVATVSPPAGVMYTITISNGQKRTTDPNSTVSFTTKRTGTHEIAISSVPATCNLAGPDLVTVNVGPFEHVDVGFSINCPGA